MTDQMFSHTDQHPAAPSDQGPPPPPDAAANPDGLLAAGTFAIWDDGAGGLVLVAHPHGGEVQRRHVPAAMVKMGQRLFGGIFGGG